MQDELDDLVLTHHRDGHVGRLHLGPHERRAEHDRDVLDLHPVLPTPLDHPTNQSVEHESLELFSRAVIRSRSQRCRLEPLNQAIGVVNEQNDCQNTLKMLRKTSRSELY